MEPILTIVIPCYNQPALLDYTLGALERQTLQNFTIVLLDDCSTQDYQPVIRNHPNLHIQVFRNQQNAGAMQNLENSILFPVTTPYVFSLHEDDFPHPEYIQCAVAALEASSGVQFVASTYVPFVTEDAAERQMQPIAGHLLHTDCDRQDFVRYCMQKNNFAFGSVVYRSSILPGHRFDLKSFSTLCDRPFLADLLTQGTCRIFQTPLFFYRLHGTGDQRSKTLTFHNCIRLYEYYRSCLPRPLGTIDHRILLKSSTATLTIGYWSLLPHQRPPFLRALAEGRKAGLVRLRYLSSRMLPLLAERVVPRNFLNKLAAIRHQTGRKNH